MNNPLISVLIPVYNVEKFVEDAVLSICNQTYKNLEIIIVDDCSTDLTFEILQEIAKKDSRIKLFRNERNLKIVGTLNRALTIAQGDFIARMDGDDISSLDRLEIQMDYLEKNIDIDLVGSHVFTIDENSKVIGKTKMPISISTVNKVMFFNSPVLHIWLARKKVYSELDGYRDILGVEDYDFLLRMASRKLKFTNVDCFLYSVRVREGNTSSTIGFSQRLMSKYVLELYNQRTRIGCDSYTSNSVQNYIISQSHLKTKYIISNDYLKKAIILKGEKKYFLMSFYLLKSIINSEVQLDYVRGRFISKIYTFFFK